MIDSVLRAFLESRYRLWIVITLTFLTLVVVGWPAADDYFALRNRAARLTASLNTTQDTVSHLTEIEKKYQDKMQQLHQLESRMADDRGLNDFRNWVVDQIRQSGCQMRKVRVGSPNSRRWRENGDPLDVSATDGPETAFNLKVVSFSVSASGGAENVRDLLARLNKSDKFSQTKRFSLHPDGSDGKEIVLDLEMMLFDLQEADIKENKPV